MRIKVQWLRYSITQVKFFPYEIFGSLDFEFYPNKSFYDVFGLKGLMFYWFPSKETHFME